MLWSISQSGRRPISSLRHCAKQSERVNKSTNVLAIPTLEQTLMKAFLKRILSSFGLNLRRYDPTHDLSKLLRLYRVETVFDAGANAGMSGRYFRNLGFTGKIVSFEPVGRYYNLLVQEAAGDSLWTSVNAALAEVEGEQEINVSGGGGGATSFLNQTGTTWARAPELAYVGRELVRVTTVDHAALEHYPEGDRLFLKLDVQGYERKVMEGARQTIPRVVGVRVELSVSPYYEDEPSMLEIMSYLYSLGFRLCAIDEAWSDPRTREVFQMDAVFFRCAAAG
jgi:FkbM family methyltransferase